MKIDWNTPVTLADLREGDDGKEIRNPGGNKSVRVAALGTCTTCDHYRAEYGPMGFFPQHDAMSNCRSGKRDHCTCDGCF